MTLGIDPSYRHGIGYQALLLGGFATLSGILLSIGNSFTEDTIEIRRQEDLLATLSQVIPADHYDQDLLENPLLMPDENKKSVKIYRAIRNERVSGLAFERSGQGYGGTIRILMGVDSKGRLLGVRVLSHAETPGLGDKIESERDDWILGFNGLSLGNPPLDQWSVKKDGGRFDQFSGATITPRAVVKAVKEGLMYFNAHQGALIAVDALTTTISEDKQP